MRISVNAQTAECAAVRDSVAISMLEDQGDSREAVAARLTRVREILGLSKRDFAAQAGMSEQTYNPFENAKRDLSLTAAKLLRKRYGVTLEFLYFGNRNDLPHRIAKDL